MAEAGAGFITTITMTNSAEAIGVTIGVARAAKGLAEACVTSFTVKTDGRLPSGEGLGEATDLVDAATDSWPTYFMINCAHPSHFAGMLAADAGWAARIRGIRTNASCRSHAELNEASELDRGNAGELARL